MKQQFFERWGKVSKVIRFLPWRGKLRFFKRLVLLKMKETWLNASSSSVWRRQCTMRSFFFKEIDDVCWASNDGVSKCNSSSAARGQKIAGWFCSCRGGRLLPRH